MYEFTVVPGGDPAGKLVALYSTKNVHGIQVITQTRSGQIMLGTNPRLPEIP